MFYYGDLFLAAKTQAQRQLICLRSCSHYWQKKKKKKSTILLQLCFCSEMKIRQLRIAGGFCPGFSEAVGQVCERSHVPALQIRGGANSSPHVSALSDKILVTDNESTSFYLYAE